MPSAAAANARMGCDADTACLGEVLGLRTLWAPAVVFRVEVGALMTRIGFEAHYTFIMIRTPQISIGNYLGP